ncbi:hypothetical protein A2348_03275 [Candidatus Uhrbacteria bacterium RIFOXYB12_FULL_58_10]|uniref:Uncharacterized protein n=1 Tax=Candidatus Uhrbacteria bacterium RIFOXYB2_FULL_57_15 TaxID=1802422 RepID=A0A1F7WAN4_9BACT|nr:MAG: hypothetical protein A2348_03275 [Candidatus Uhrbacteria bacterium RIFOXYB12_FULL_58_10]OGL99448.1 MAG: hypothetical protein A2304_02405 [Candidatus Uhrbacteria bacterium RIFOXYB2_FULL_57_15]OGL99889.1 MAG: hypothetical protein A2501_05155 [Candidatus Uhrbacteria bacterium RIFOXYC12_FULL_57_11]
MRTFSLTVLVYQSKDIPVTITADPPLERRQLSIIEQWIGNARELMDGTYTLVLGAPEDGLYGDGPDGNSVTILRRRLFTPMENALAALNAAYGVYPEDDDELVQLLANDIAQSDPGKIVGHAEAIVPGFLFIRVGCPCCGASQLKVETFVVLSANMQLTDDGSEERDRMVALLGDYGITPDPRLATASFAVVYPGADCTNPFGADANAKLQRRIDALLPRIEAVAIPKLLEVVAAATERINAGTAAIRRQFPQTS